jgi:hypothetical protein
MISVSTSADGNQVYLRIENLSKDCVTCDGACRTRENLGGDNTSSTTRRAGKRLNASDAGFTSALRRSTHTA